MGSIARWQRIEKPRPYDSAAPVRFGPALRRLAVLEQRRAKVWMAHRVLRPRDLMRALFIFLSLMLAVLGCSGSSGTSDRSPMSPSSAPAQWATPFIGSPPASVSVFRMQPGIRQEHVDSRMFERRSATDHLVVMAMTSCRQVDTYDGVIAVLHEVSRAIDPARHSSWTFLGQSASGVRAYQPANGKPEGARLFVLPSSTWVIGLGVAAQRIGWALAARATEPPTLDALPGVFMEATFRADARMLERLRRVRGNERIIALGYVAYVTLGPRGTQLFDGGTIVFADDDSARAAADELARLLATSPPSQVTAALLGTQPSSGPEEPVFLERYGATVVLRGMTPR